MKGSGSVVESLLGCRLELQRRHCLVSLSRTQHSDTGEAQSHINPCLYSNGSTQEDPS